MTETTRLIPFSALLVIGLIVGFQFHSYVLPQSVWIISNAGLFAHDDFIGAGPDARNHPHTNHCLGHWGEMRDYDAYFIARNNHAANQWRLENRDDPTQFERVEMDATMSEYETICRRGDAKN